MGLLKLFQRIGLIAEANANEGIDNMEDPVIMTKQAIRDLKTKYDTAVQAELKVKANEIGKRTEAAKQKEEANEWEVKANQLLQRAEDGKISHEDAERMAAEALQNQQKCENMATKFTNEAEFERKNMEMLDKKIVELKNMITETKDSLTNLASRQETAEATVAINKELSSLGGLNNTKELIERMKKKTEKLEFEGQAYTELETSHMTVSEEIDKVLADDKPDIKAKLDALKAKRATVKTEPVV